MKLKKSRITQSFNFLHFIEILLIKSININDNSILSKGNNNSNLTPKIDK
jgi:hypothetical protein